MHSVPCSNLSTLDSVSWRVRSYPWTTVAVRWLLFFQCWTNQSVTKDFQHRNDVPVLHFLGRLYFKCELLVLLVEFRCVSELLHVRWVWHGRGCGKLFAAIGLKPNTVLIHDLQRLNISDYQKHGFEQMVTVKSWPTWGTNPWASWQHTHTDCTTEYVCCTFDKLPRHTSRRQRKGSMNRWRRCGASVTVT